MEQRTLAQLLPVVLLKLRLLDCHTFVLGSIWKTHFPCLALKNQMASNVLHYN